MSLVWIQEVEGVFGGRGDCQKGLGKEAVDFQSGTDLEGRLHKGPPPQARDFFL